MDWSGIWLISEMAWNKASSTTQLINWYEVRMSSYVCVCTEGGHFSIQWDFRTHSCFIANFVNTESRPSDLYLWPFDRKIASTFTHVSSNLPDKYRDFQKDIPILSKWEACYRQRDRQILKQFHIFNEEIMEQSQALSSLSLTYIDPLWTTTWAENDLHIFISSGLDLRPFDLKFDLQITRVPWRLHQIHFFRAFGCRINWRHGTERQADRWTETM